MQAGAITAFQAANGLPQTGELDADTSWRLLEDVRTTPSGLGEDDS